MRHNDAMRRRSRIPLLLAGLLLALGGGVHAAEKAYMTQVSELLGIVGAPRHLRDACAARVPDLAPALRASYAAWRRRHAGLLAAIAAQVELAETHAKRQGSPFEVADLDRSGAAGMHERMRGVAPAQAREICRGYDAFLQDMDATMHDTVPQRLEAVTRAGLAAAADTRG